MTKRIAVTTREPIFLRRSDGAPVRLKILRDGPDRREAFATRCRAYRALGFAVGGADGLYRDAFDDDASTALIGLYDGNALTGSLRVSFADARSDLSALPCARYYPALMYLQRRLSGPIMEVSGLAIDPGVSNLYARTSLNADLVRASLAAAEAARPCLILLAARKSWVRTYQRLLSMHVIGLPAHYPPGDAPISLMGTTLSAARERLRAVPSFYHMAQEDIARLHDELALCVQNGADAAALGCAPPSRTSLARTRKR